MEKETRIIQSFDKIRFKDFGNLILTQGDQESLTIEADAELMAELISEVRDDTLVLALTMIGSSELARCFLPSSPIRDIRSITTSPCQFAQNQH